VSALCVILGCRIRGRHQSACEDDQCPGCVPRTTDGAFACEACAQRARGHLRIIVETAPDARLVAAGLVRRGGGGGSGKPGSRPPLNDGATDALTEVQATITTLARDIAETRGLTVPRSGHQLDPIVVAARWLTGQVEWLTHAVDGHEPRCIGAFAEIAACAGRVRGVVDGAPGRKYLGPCGARLCGLCGIVEQDHVCEGDIPVWTCEGDVHVRPGAEQGTCRSCGARVDRQARQEWLDEQVADRAYRAAHIADAYRINVNTIRSWAERGRLVPHGQDRLGRPLYLVGDVRELAREAADRRMANETRRARREAAEMGA